MQGNGNQISQHQGLGFATAWYLRGVMNSVIALESGEPSESLLTTAETKPASDRIV